VRRINDEPFDVPSVPGSRAVTIKFMIPNSRMGSVIGKQGSKIKEIQDASGARLNASEGMLPGSTEVLHIFSIRLPFLKFVSASP
jgi:poly(rC)-binding protein 2/3/4